MTREFEKDYREILETKNKDRLIYLLVIAKEKEEIYRKMISAFESRTCENCKHRYIANECFNKNSPTYGINKNIPKDFGCNKWE